MDTCCWNAGLFEHLLDLRRPLLHEPVDVGHRLGVVDRRRRLRAMQIGDVLDPLVDLLRALLAAVYLADLNRLGRGLLRYCAQLQLEDGGVALLCSRLVQHRQAQVLLLAVGPRHLARGSSCRKLNKYSTMEVYYVFLLLLARLDILFQYVSLQMSK